MARTAKTKNSKPDYRAGLNSKGEISIKTSKGSMDSDSESGFPTYVPTNTAKESGEASGSAAPNQEDDNSSAKRGGDHPDVFTFCRRDREDLQVSMWPWMRRIPSHMEMPSSKRS